MQDEGFVIVIIASSGFIARFGRAMCKQNEMHFGQQ